MTTTTATKHDQALLAEAKGDVDVACRLLWAAHEWFDGEYAIGYSTEIKFRERIGASTAGARHKLAEVHAAEDRMVREFAERNR